LRGNKAVDIHNYEGRLQRIIERLKNGEVKQTNAKLLLQFSDYLSAQRNISVGRVEHYLQLLVKAARILNKPFKSAIKEDITRVISTLKNEGLSEKSIRDYCIFLRVFYKWLRGYSPKSKEYPPEVADLVPPHPQPHYKGNILTESDVFKLIQACEGQFSLRNQTLISVAWDSAGRIGEILGMRRQDIKFDANEPIAVVDVEGKTGHRQILLVESLPYLTKLLDSLPQTPDSFVFLDSNGEGLSYPAANRMLYHVKKRARIHKKFSWHSLRHSRATFLCQRMREPMLKQVLGWAPDSDMMKTYLHLSL
jgi:site-specific recombinase XerD